VIPLERIVLDVKVPGDPQPKERARTWTDKDGRSRSRTPERTKSWAERAEWLIRRKFRGRPVLIPAVVAVVAVFPRPLTRPAAVDPALWADGSRAPRPVGADLDNVEKAAWDALTASGVLSDDRIVVQSGAAKFWASAAEGPSVRIVVALARPGGPDPCEALLAGPSPL
jgi:Holliday junction resolvase RusA-like endonuclease